MSTIPYDRRNLSHFKYVADYASLAGKAMLPPRRPPEAHGVPIDTPATRLLKRNPDCLLSPGQRRQATLASCATARLILLSSTDRPPEPTDVLVPRCRFQSRSS